jgi:ubiquinone/menaquinone biosynthesis C-methylase UbiE
MHTLTGFEDKITKIVFSYFFDVDKPFGLKFPKLIAQNEKDFALASTVTHSSKRSHESLKTNVKNGFYVSYPQEGKKDYKLLPANMTASSLFLQHMLSEETGPYLHLDIGGGSGDFALALEEAAKKYGRDIEGHTVSASDLRSLHSRVPDNRYHVCNASKILAEESIATRQWNSIICITTLVYLEDNARNLADFYELLAPGGLLVVENPSFLGIENLEEMTKFLNETGYSIIAFFSKDDLELHEITTLILQKTHAHLNFPINYHKQNPISNHANYRALYAPAPCFLSVQDKNEMQQKIKNITTTRLFVTTDWDEDPPTSVFPPKSHQLYQLYQRALAPI